jgi:hypothetical protein
VSRLARALRANAPLLAVVAVAAVPLIRVGIAQYVEFDGWFHLFVSRAESLRTFHPDWHKTAHPPLYFLLLEATSLLGRSWLAYRVPSILAGLVSVFLVGKIAERTTASRIYGVLAAAAFGLSSATVTVSCEVRSYTLAVAFMLAAFLWFLDDKPVLFAAAVIAGILSLYATAFFLVAAIIVGVAYRRRRAFLLSYLAPVLVLAVAYRFHMYRWTHPLNHLPEFYFDPTRESRLAFLLTGIRQEISLFSPIAFPSRWVIPLSIALIVAAVAGLIFLLRKRASAATATVAMTIVLCALIAGASLLGKYPFGGQLRHQFLIYPFLVLGAVSVIGVVSRHRAVIAILALAIVANAAAGYSRFQIIRSPLFLDELKQFRAVVPPSSMLYLDEFSTISLFSFYDTWDWHLASSDSIHTLHYEVTHGNNRMDVVRVRNQWNFNPLDAALYRDLRRSMDLHAARSAGLFALSTIPAGIPEQEVRSRIIQAAAGSGLAIEEMRVDGGNLYVRVAVTDYAAW